MLSEPVSPGRLPVAGPGPGNRIRAAVDPTRGAMVECR
jgi:hypothetical protein